MTAGPVTVTACVVSHNSAAQLSGCLSSLLAQQDAGLEVVVVDNASQDDSAALVRERFPTVCLTASTQNLGYGAGQNLAAQQGQGKFLLFMNPDVHLSADAVARMVQVFRARPQAGACGPRMVDKQGALQASCRRFPDLGAGLFRATFLERLLPHNRSSRRYLMWDLPHDQETSVDWLSGACLMVSRAAWEEAGGFDERYFMYCEDVDLCYRLAKAGWERVYVPNAQAVHTGAHSTGQVPLKMVWERHRSMYRFYRTHYASGHAPAMRALVAAGIWARCCAALARTAALKAARPQQLIRP